MTANSTPSPSRSLQEDTSTERPALVARLSRVTKSYGSVRALDGFSLDVVRGEVLSLLGPNGAGKTTAISVLLGLLEADSGVAHCFGRPPRQLAVRQRIGAMLQTAGIALNLTVLEQIDLFRSYYARPASFETLVEVADLSKLLNRRTTALSGGQLRRLMFALALAGDPELLFLDEPTAGLDLESRYRLWAKVRELTAQGKTVLLTTHHLEEAAALADRVVVIDQGRNIAEGTPAELENRVAGRRIRCVTSLTLEQVRELAGVRRVNARGTAIEILTSQAEEVLRVLFERDPTLHDLEVGGVGLEQAFLTLTSRDQPNTTDHDEEQAA